MVRDVSTTYCSTHGAKHVQAPDDHRALVFASRRRPRHAQKHRRLKAVQVPASTLFVTTLKVDRPVPVVCSGILFGLRPPLTPGSAEISVTFRRPGSDRAATLLEILTPPMATALGALCKDLRRPSRP